MGLVSRNELGIEEVTCVIHKEEDPYTLAVKGNADEDTYSPMDLFDWVELISKMRDEGYKGKDIADRLNWSAQNVSNYNNVFTRISTQVLEKAKHHQKGRVDNKSTVVDFTEGWFRNSGLYDLNEKYQGRLMDDFIQDKFSWNSGKVKRESAKYKMRDEGLTQQEIADKIGWSEGNVKKYSMLLNKVPHILEKSKQHQEGRGTSLVPTGTFSFTEGWFRSSGLYGLNEKYQERLMGHLSHQNPRNLMVSPVYVWK